MVPTTPMDSVFFTIQYPLKLSICYDPCTSTYVVNSKDLLFFNSIVPAIHEDIILVGDMSVAVYCREKRIMKKVIYRLDGKNICNLILEDVAFVLNFHINIVVIDFLRK